MVTSALPECEQLVEKYRIGWTAAPADPRSVAGALRRALAARGDIELANRLHRAASELCWTRERERLLGLYSELAAAS